MSRKGILVVISVLLVVGLLVGIGCAGEVIQPTSPTATAPASTTPGGTSPTASTSPTSTGSPSPSQATVIKWRGQASYPITPDPDPNNRWRLTPNLPVTAESSYRFVEWVKKVTGGRLVIDIAPPASIVPVADMLTAVENGTLDFAGLHYGGNHTGIVPEANIEIGLPFAWSIPEEAWDGYYNWGIRDVLQEAYTPHNAYVFPFGMGDLYHFGTTFNPTGPDAIKGKKIRALGIYGSYVQALGGSPSTIAWGELYMAAKLGTIDGYIGGPSGLEDSKLKEVLNYYVVDPNPNTIGGSFYINIKSLNALPADIKTLLTETAPYIIAGWANDYYTFEHRILAQTAAQGYTKPVVWSPEDTAKARAIGIKLWDDVAAKSPRCKQLVDLVKAQMKDLGKM